MKRQPEQQQEEQQEQKKWYSPVSDRWAALRDKLIHTLPAFVVNSSSNVVGAIQLVAEAMMFKSSGFDLLDKETKSKSFFQQPHKYVFAPVKNVFGTAFGKLKGSNGAWKDMIKPSNWGETARNFIDLERATKIDLAKGPLTNNISAFSSLTGMSAMTLATVLPDRKESAEETERMAEMAHTNPVKYAGLRVYQALNPLEWIDNKRQIAGLGMTATGMMSFLSGFRQVGKLENGTQYYRRNVWHMLGGAITTFAGMQLWFNINNQQGWTNFGTTQLARITTLPASITSRFKADKMGGKEQGAAWYLAGQGTMVLKNSTASLLGGAEIRNGEVVDHRKMRLQAKEKFKGQKPGRDEASETPSTRVGDVSAREPMHDAAVALQA